jgi:hypothetical protein
MCALPAIAAATQWKNAQAREPLLLLLLLLQLLQTLSWQHCSTAAESSVALMMERTAVPSRQCKMDNP